MLHQAGFLRDKLGNVSSSSLPTLRWASNEAVIAVAHGGIIVEFLLNHYSEQELIQVNPRFRHMAHCGITHVSYDGDRIEVKCLGRVLHDHCD